jgi:hypothetical protein
MRQLLQGGRIQRYVIGIGSRSAAFEATKKGDPQGPPFLFYGAASGLSLPRATPGTMTACAAQIPAAIRDVFWNFFLAPVSTKKDLHETLALFLTTRT